MKSKKITTIYVNEELWEKAKEKFHSVSELINDFLEVIVENPAYGREQLKLAYLRIQQQEVEHKIESIKWSLENYELELQHLKDITQEQQVLVAEVKRKEEIALRFREMIAIIETNAFDVEDSWVETEYIRKKLDELGREVTREGFEKHCKRLEQLKLGTLGRI